MALGNVLLILFSVTLSAVAQLALKTGMSRPALQAALKDGSPLEIGLAIGFSPLVVGGLFTYFLGAVVWLFVLSKVDLSQAYPFVGLGFILTMLLSIFVLSEPVTTLRIVGTLVIVAGVVMVSQS